MAFPEKLQSHVGLFELFTAHGAVMFY